jgi:hypothetical protein
MGLNATAFLEGIMGQSIIDEANSYLTGMNQSYVQEQMDLYTNNTLAYLEAKGLSNATLNDLLGYRTIIKEKLGILPNSLPYKSHKLAEYSEIPDNLRHKIKFEIYGNTTTLSMPELAGRRLTLSYLPATEDDAAIIESYGGITNVPAYLVEMKPVLMVEGEPKAIGKADTLGETQQFVMEFQMPNGERDRVANDVTVGAYYAVGLNVGKVPEKLLHEHQASLKTWGQILPTANYTDDRIIGEMLYTTAMAYFYELDIFNEINARTNGVFLMRQPSENIVALDLTVSYLFWSPFDLDLAGMNMDVDRNIYVAFPNSGKGADAHNFMLTSGYLGSALEHGIFEQLYSIPSVSAVKVLQIANQEGIPIYTINATNINEILPRLQVSEAVKAGIRGAVASGMVVTIPEKNIQYYNWSGVGYIVLNPETGAGAYMISGGLAGGFWALVLGCFKEIKDFVYKIRSNFLKFMQDFFDDFLDITNAPISSANKAAAYLLLLQFYLHLGIYLWAFETIAISGVLPLLLVTLIFIAILAVLYIFMKIIIKDPAFKNCRRLIG